jgi:hypothetical protein
MHPTEGLSTRFSCGIGVKQGCPLSPLLFGLYLDGLEKHLDALDGDSPPQLADIVVKLLLYVDDLALMSETPQGLQKQIDAPFEFCVERQLVINVSKTRWWCLRNAVVQRQSSHIEGQPLSEFNHSNTWA